MRLRTVVILLSVSLIAAACGSRGGGTTSATTTPGTTGGATSGLTASDVGITPTEIHVASVQDVGGPVPGLFESSKDAMQAFTAYINSQGGINGRKLVVDYSDAQISSTNFQIATQAACSGDFSMVGSYSIGDAGAVSPSQQCGLPLVPAATTAPQVIASPNVVSPLPVRPNVFNTGYFHWLAQTYPAAVKKAGLLYPNNPVTITAAQRTVGTSQSQGFNWLVDAEVGLIQVDFSSYILQMKNSGVQLFSWVADNSAETRILTQAQQQGWHPQVFDGSATGYSSTFLHTNGALAEGTFISLPISLFEETNGDPMMATYLHWLNTVPGHVAPDIFGVSSWSAGLLFAKAMQMAGKNPTRPQLLRTLHSIKSWNGDGIQAQTDPGDGIGTHCFNVIKFQGDKFVRVHPLTPNTFDCTGHLYTVPGMAPS